MGLKTERGEDERLRQAQSKGRKKNPVSSPALPGKGQPFLPKSGYAHDTPNKTLFLLCLKQLRLVSVPCNQSPDQLKYQSGVVFVEGVMGVEEVQSVTEWI